MKERKDTLITVRVTDDERNALEYLCENTGKSTSDVIARACMYFLNTRASDLEDYLEDDIGGSFGGEVNGGRNGSGTDVRRKKTVRVHARMSESVAEGLKNRGSELGEGFSQMVRKAIKSFASVTDSRY